MFDAIFNLKIDYKQYSFFLLALINILTTPPSLPLKGRSYLLASLKGEELSLDLPKKGEGGLPLANLPLKGRSYLLASLKGEELSLGILKKGGAIS